MLAIVTLIALLSFAEASQKTPRTAIPSSLSSSSTATATTLATIPSVATTVSNCVASAQLNMSSPTRRLTGASVALGTRCTSLPLDIPTSTTSTFVPTGTASDPEITPSPELPLEGVNFHTIDIKYVQTTYWSCVTFPLETHCGWHEPILDAGAAGMRYEDSGKVALRAGVVAGIVAGGLALGI
ncbi:uncharacterized protein F4812DRAFT_461223 [Daldinia caldariorum]|uniref:uncharacterized protein n=1 Tax=Daldinia caldariorum TaxID=326644 RepID=UPI00200866D9|nr:uncharacterized protein F4812DRAFT_461223 [Daldinia caldariorum]KAI1466253.1 hypothetical protein F4812DRAFT_461223 [Daldinia caldariorum]